MIGDGPQMYGSTGGRDVFAFAPGNGKDFVWDFHKGEDHIELDGLFEVPLPSTAAVHLPAQAANHLLKAVPIHDPCTAPALRTPEGRKVNPWCERLQAGRPRPCRRQQCISYLSSQRRSHRRLSHPIRSYHATCHT